MKQEYKRICCNCSKPFVTPYASKKYCSDECRKLDEQKRHRMRKHAERMKTKSKCVICGGVLDDAEKMRIGRPTLYCKECLIMLHRYRAYKRRMTAEFKTPKSFEDWLIECQTKKNSREDKKAQKVIAEEQKKIKPSEKPTVKVCKHKHAKVGKDQNTVTCTCRVCGSHFEAPSNSDSKFCNLCLEEFGPAECIEIANEQDMKTNIEKSMKSNPHKVCSLCGAFFEDTSQLKDRIFCDRCTTNPPTKFKITMQKYRRKLMGKM